MPYVQQMQQEMLRLAQALLQQTRQEKIKWETTDNDNQFLFSSAKSAILIRGSFGDYDESGEGDFILELLNRGGSVAGRFEIGYEDVESPEEAPNYELLKELYLEVRNNALEIDITLEDIHRALGIETDSESTPSGG